jgi:3-hydroxyisobutyrate dehydrogenase
MRIGFIGLGAMGRHMAANLQRAGHEVQAHDLRRVDGFPNWKTSAAEAARGCDVVFTSLPGPKEVQALAPEISSALVKDASWFDLSTNSPEVVRRLHRELPKIHFLDAPVSGGPSGAESGKLAIWVGGDEEIFKRFKPVLEDIGDQPLYIGPIGAGTVAKLAHNCASFAIQAVLAEIFTLGVKGGVEPLALFQALRQGASGRKRTFDRLADFYLPGRFDPAAFSLKLAHKDATLALELAEGMRRGWAERDCRAAMLLQEERAGVAARVSPERMPDALKD